MNAAGSDDDGDASSAVEDPFGHLTEGPRMIHINRTSAGFGFTVAGSRPVRVKHVTSGSTASAKGLKPGDQIMEVNGHEVSMSHGCLRGDVRGEGGRCGGRHTSASLGCGACIRYMTPTTSYAAAWLLSAVSVASVWQACLERIPQDRLKCI